MDEKRRMKLAKMKQSLKDAGVTQRRKFVNVKCTVCGKEIKIRTNDASIYTDEVRKKFVCLLCK